MAKITVKLPGELIRKMDSLGKETDRIVKASLEAAGEPVKSAAGMDDAGFADGIIGDRLLGAVEDSLAFHDVLGRQIGEVLELWEPADVAIVPAARVVHGAPIGQDLLSGGAIVAAHEQVDEPVGVLIGILKKL